jgi:hypothetical protein
MSTDLTISVPARHAGCTSENAVQGAGVQCGILAFVMILAASAGCREHEPAPLPPIEYYLEITGSIPAAEADSSSELIWIADAVHSPDGNIVVLDFLREALIIFTPEGEYIRTVGRGGEGPGEFDRPGEVACSSNGDLLIRDAIGLSRFDGNCEFIDRTTWPFFPPSLVACLDDGSLIGIERTPRPSDEGVRFTSTLGLWDGGEDPSVEYFSIDFEWPIGDESADLSHSRESHIHACATHDGRVFFSRSSVDGFEIRGCERDGTQFFHVRDDSFERMRKSEDELRIEMEYLTGTFNRMTNGGSGQVDMEPDPYRQAILGMFIDGEERLWVRLGFYPGIIFRVYDMCGNTLFHVMLDYDGSPLDLMDWQVCGNEYGFLAYDELPEDCERVYILNLQPCSLID